VIRFSGGVIGSLTPSGVSLVTRAVVLHDWLRDYFEEQRMIDLYYWTTPNGHKITIFLEETGLS
jgi:hypothetical protein